MATVSKLFLSGSTKGRAIKVAAVGTPGTTIHTGSSVNTDIDEVWIYAQNTDTTNRKLTVEWGGTSAPDDLIEITIPAESGLTLVAPGLLIGGDSSAALVVRAFAPSGAGNLLTIHGYVNRIA
jgi:hypothetical protein